MLSSIGRAAVRRVVAGGPQSTNRSFLSIWHLQRTTRSKDGDDGLLFSYRRSYATATKAAAKPKSKSTTTAKAKTTAKPSAKKTSTEKSTKAKAKKPVKKPVKKKIVAKPKKKSIKKVLSEEQKQRAAIKSLREQALVIPKQKPFNSWTVYLVEHKSTSGSVVDKSRELQHTFKDISPAELESLNHTANQNKIDNEVMIKEWVESHPPEIIKRANNARSLLRKKYKKSGFSPIPDSRRPKKATIARSFFIKDRYASGDMKGISFGEASKLIAREWTALSPDERKPYEDREVEDRSRYIEEFKTVFHRDPSIGQAKLAQT